MRITLLISGAAIGLTVSMVGLVLVWLMLLTNNCNSSMFCNLLFYVGVIAEIAGPIIGLIIAISGLLLPVHPKDPRYHNIPWPKQNVPEKEEETPMTEVILPPKSRHISRNHSKEKYFQSLCRNDQEMKKLTNMQGAGYLHPEGGARVWQA